jgi:hypothetical protein
MFNLETCKMQTLAVEIATTFVDDAAALVTGFGRTIWRAAMAPIDRIANACDIAGVLAERRATFRMWRANRARTGHRFSLLGRLSPFRHLAHLT